MKFKIPKAELPKARIPTAKGSRIHRDKKSDYRRKEKHGKRDEK